MFSRMRLSQTLHKRTESEAVSHLRETIACAQMYYSLSAEFMLKREDCLWPTAITSSPCSLLHLSPVLCLIAVCSPQIAGNTFRKSTLSRWVQVGRIGAGARRWYKSFPEAGKDRTNPSAFLLVGIHVRRVEIMRGSTTTDESTLRQYR
jgi:hypothetical protein